MRWKNGTDLSMSIKITRAEGHWRGLKKIPLPGINRSLKATEKIYKTGSLLNWQLIKPAAKSKKWNSAYNTVRVCSAAGTSNRNNSCKPNSGINRPENGEITYYSYSAAEAGFQSYRKWKNNHRIIKTKLPHKA